MDYNKVYIKDKLDLDNLIEIPYEYYKDTGIKELKAVNVTGVIKKDNNDDFVINITIDGTMMIEDSITLDVVPYPFNIELSDEVVQNNENYLDIIELLWQNIVLEIPLRYTLVDDLSDYVNSSEDKEESDLANSRNPFQDLLEKLEKKESD